MNEIRRKILTEYILNESRRLAHNQHRRQLDFEVSLKNLTHYVTELEKVEAEWINESPFDQEAA